MLRVAVCTFGLAFASSVLAQTPASPPAGAAPAQTSTGTAVDKKAVSKECSSQADAKNLHGKARKTFRSKCKMMGGKAA